MSGAQGKSRTVNVEVRRKKSYISREALEEKARLQAGRAGSAACC